MKALVDGFIIMGAAIALLGLIAKLSGIFLIAPTLRNPINHVIIATFFLMLALIIDCKTK